MTRDVSITCGPTSEQSGRQSRRASRSLPIWCGPYWTTLNGPEDIQSDLGSFMLITIPKNVT